MYGIGKFPGPLDAGLQLQAAAALAASGQSAAIDLGEGFSPAPAKPVGLVVQVDALKTSAGNETYTLKVQESADGITFVETGLSFTVTATGTLYKIAGVTKRYVRLAHVLAGTLPAVTLSAWLTAA